MKKQFLLFTALVISLVAISQPYNHQQKIIAGDGSANQSNLLETKPAFANAIHISPNPTKDFLIISLDDKNITGFIKTEDRNGNVFINTKYVQNGQHINVSILKQGIYCVSFLDKDGQLYKSTFIKE